MSDKETPNKPNETCEKQDFQDDEIDLVELAKTVWQGRKLIAWIVAGCTLATIIISLFMTNIYTATAVLKPVSQMPGSSKSSSLAAQFGGIANIAGIAMPNPSSSTEIVKLLESIVLKKEVIERYNLLPILFPDDWDAEKKVWKKPGIIKIFMAKIRPARPGTQASEPGVPGIWDGIRELEDIVKIDYDLKNDIITVSTDFDDPDMAAQIAKYFIITVNEHMCSEAKRVAIINKQYLEKQLVEAKDPIIQQKIYGLIAEKIETIMMAEVKEGFAFKELDPPMAPDRKTKPKRAIIVTISFFFSFCLAIGFVFSRDYLKESLKRITGGHHAE